MSNALVQSTTSNHFSATTQAHSLLLCVAEVSNNGTSTIPSINTPTTSGFTWTLAKTTDYNYSFFDCFSGNVGVKTPAGFIPIGELPQNNSFVIVNETGTHLAELIVHEPRTRPMIDMGDGLLVTLDHPMRMANGEYDDAQVRFADCPRLSFDGGVYTLHVISDNEEDKHFILENGEVAHNKLNQTIYNNGTVAVYYIANASSMSSSTTTSVTATAGSVSFRLYEFSGVGTVIDATAADDAINTSATVTAGNITTTETDLIFVAASLSATTSSGWTAGVVNNDQFRLNQSAGTLSTAFAASTIYWACVAVAFVPGSQSVSPSGVAASFAVGTPSTQAGSAISPSGVSAEFTIGTALPGGAVAFAIPSGVSAIFSLGAVSAGIPINYGNVVSGSSGVPSGVNTTYFYARWTGWLTVDTSGEYTLGVNAQDGADFYIGTQPLVRALAASQTANSSATYTNSSTVNLAANVVYPIVVEWTHGSGGSYECQLLWTPPGSAVPSIIPASNLSLTGTWWNGSSGDYYPNTWY